MAYNWHDILRFTGFPGGQEIASEVRLNCPEFTGEDVFGTKFDVGRAQSTVDQDFVEGLIRKETTPQDPFRHVNEGLPTSKGEYERTLFALKNAGGYVRYDRALIDRDATRGAFLMRAEATRLMEDAIRALGKQFFYGSGANATAGGASSKGFQGLEKFVSSAYTVSAGGSAAGSGDTGLSSAYFVRFSALDGVCWLFGRNGQFELSDVKEVEYADPSDSTRLIPYYQQCMEYYPGLAVNSQYAAVRIANIDVSTASTPASISTTALTDKHLLVALEKFKGGRPDALFMSRAAGVLLGASRTPTINVSGKSFYTGEMQIPTEIYGIPILYTDSLCGNEAAFS